MFCPTTRLRSLGILFLSCLQPKSYWPWLSKFCALLLPAVLWLYVFVLCWSGLVCRSASVCHSVCFVCLAAILIEERKATEVGGQQQQQQQQKISIRPLKKARRRRSTATATAPTTEQRSTTIENPLLRTVLTKMTPPKPPPPITNDKRNSCHRTKVTTVTKLPKRMPIGWLRNRRVDGAQTLAIGALVGGLLLLLAALFGVTVLTTA